ncbi:MAG: bifunctional glutamate N-acetyltransferase/amino-acid acetyltransferase ArgJ [Aggregatilineales bacterium]
MLRVDSVIGSIPGFRAAGVHAGLKKEGQPDFALILADRPCATAGVFTRSQVKAAPVLLSQKHLHNNAGQIRAITVNTVSANAATGEQGMENARQMSALVAEQAGLSPEQVLVMSTGVIGTQLPMQKIAHGAELSYAQLGRGWQSAATAIMTTDTQPKMASTQIMTVHGNYHIAGISKGSGMIAPNMATMLGVIVTDAKMSVAQAQQALKAANEVSFNRIVVDGDTSTNDMVVLMAGGASGVEIASDADLVQFTEFLTMICTKLAQDVVRDGEGASKFITLDVFGADDDAAAAQIAHTIAASPLVKTAFAGNDANVGRLLMAIGRAGVDLDVNKLRLWISSGEQLFEDDRGLLLFENGAFTDYSEDVATEIVSEEASYISLECGSGSGQATVWTCDLTHEYVSINADYRS